MQQPYWDDWRKFLTQRGLTPLICAVLDQTGSLLPLFSQFMFLGMPFFKMFSWNNYYCALIDTLVDKDTVDDFSHFLREEKG